MVRGTGPTDLDGVLTAVGGAVQLGETQARFRCHFVRSDGNGRVRLRALTDTVAQSVVDYCLPRTRALEAYQRYVESGSTDRLVALATEARQLFTKLNTSGEGGELLLFVLLERLLGIPQIICKMNLKTNPQVHFHGVDGVHIQALDSGGLAIYWCESKLHASVSSAIGDCFTSIAPYLLDEGDGSSQRDLALVRQFLDSGSPELDNVLVRYFSTTDPESARREIRGAALIGFDHDDYPDTSSDDADAIAGATAASIADWGERVGGRVVAAGVQAFEIEVLCLPMPSVAGFRDAMRQSLGGGTA